MRSVPELRRSPAGPNLSRSATRRRRRRVRWAWGVGLFVLAIATLLIADVVVHRDRIYPGVEVAGIPVGGLGLQEAAGRLEAEADRLSERPIRFRWSEGSLSASPRSLGWRPNPGGTAEAAFLVGRSGPPWADVWDRVLARVRPVQVSWEASWDRAELAGTIEPWNEAAGTPPREGRVRVRGTSVTPVDPGPGREVDADAVAMMVPAVLEGHASETIPLPLVRTHPVTTSEDVALAEEEIRDLLDGPITARLGPLEVDIRPRAFGELIRTEVDPDDGLRVELVPRRVGELLEPYRPEVETRPRPAGFVVRGDRVRIRGSEPGRVLDEGLATERLLAIAGTPERAGRIPLAREQPSFTPADARALGIRREVASFTTHHAAGEPRVQNIHRAADILDGAIVQPGETFSLNERLGERTGERGFVSAPVIYDGEFTMDIGGGVSQLATTTFNAAFFAGYPFIEYQAHSFYISRYPMGREATVSYPKPDLIFRNDTPTGALIATEYTASSITVRIFGQRHGRRVTATDPVITGRSGSGFSVRVERIVEQGGEEVRRDTYTTFYRG